MRNSFPWHDFTIKHSKSITTNRIMIMLINAALSGNVRYFSGNATQFPLLLEPTWWRHQMEAFSALLALCAGNSPVPGEFPTQRPVTRSFDVFFDLRLNKRLSKQSWGWWSETPPRSLWRQSNEVKCLLQCTQSTRGIPDMYYWTILVRERTFGMIKTTLKIVNMYLSSYFTVWLYLLQHTNELYIKR